MRLARSPGPCPAPTHIKDDTPPSRSPLQKNHHRGSLDASFLFCPPRQPDLRQRRRAAAGRSLPPPLPARGRVCSPPPVPPPVFFSSPVRCVFSSPPVALTATPRTTIPLPMKKPARPPLKQRGTPPRRFFSSPLRLSLPGLSRPPPVPRFPSFSSHPIYIYLKWRWPVFFLLRPALVPVAAGAETEAGRNQTVSAPA